MNDEPTLIAGWNLPELRESTYPTPDELHSRRNATSGPAIVSPAGDVAVREQEIAGIPCVICEPGVTTGIALYFHGGGYRLGTAAHASAFASRIASRIKLTVIVVDYRLAPENPFPAGVADAAAVYEASITTLDAPLLLGDSAGGGLAASLTVATDESGFPPPAAMALMSPWLDLSCTAGSFNSRAATDQLFSLAAAQEAASMYLQGHDPADPLASPVRAELDRWPPTLLMASTDEVLLDDSIAFAASLARAGTDVTTWFRGGVPHAWPAVFPNLPESMAAVEIIGAFTDRLRADRQLETAAG